MLEEPLAAGRKASDGGARERTCGVCKRACDAVGMHVAHCTTMLLKEDSSLHVELR